MFELPVTKESYKFLGLIYEEYLRKRDTMPKYNAVYFKEIPDFVLVHIRDFNCPDCISELKNIGFVKTDTLGGFELTDKSIVYMENRFKKGISEISDFLSSLK